ncbi:restriction endonuclease [Streptomyces beijiangensis]|uniref:Restriction endonuclease n=1 Tax=Streptomyces beijiangensis TaxID=163361 RepID=A0A939F4L6_9ACTN|nr:restriction endonuclease [Streptomyces beijiangensis]MBO0511813.1 restriction endonuclease [Streptomyces beijiangensis]
MVNEAALLESRSLRDEAAERTEVLDKVKQLRIAPEGLHLTTKDVAEYFEVAEAAIRNMVTDHREELESNGYRLATPEEVRALKALASVDRFTSQVALFTRRTVLNVAMLLRDSIVARQVRTSLLDGEQAQRLKPVDKVFHSLAEWLDQRITDTVAQHTSTGGNPAIGSLLEHAVTGAVQRAVLPLLNIAIANDTEQRTRIDALTTEVTRLGRILRERESAGSMGAIDAMNPYQFEQHIAWLCRRDGCHQVTVTGGNGDTGADIIAFTPDGRRIVIQCKSRNPGRQITSGDVQQFIGMAKLDYRAEVALLVATCGFTRDATLLAARHQVTAVHRGLLKEWNDGVTPHQLN